MTAPLRYVFLLAIFSCGNVAADCEYRNNTAAALRALLAASNQIIPKTSSCYGTYFAGKPATVKDLVSVQLANLRAGENVISGSCIKSKCSLEIRHANGEDVSYASISFVIQDGAARTPSLACVITP